MNPSTAAARSLVDELVRSGVAHVVLAPGSRSAPLAFALAAAHAAGTVRLHVRIDERSAGFTALGLARVAGATAVVTTSGTAVANLHPAVLEAHHSGVPLIVLSADRPHELRGTGANQTTDQVRMFGSATRYFADVPAPDGRDGEIDDLRHVVARALAAARGIRSGDPGPVQVNLAWREPLVPQTDQGARDEPALPLGPPAVVVQADQRPDAVVLDHVPETVVVAGDGAGAAAAEFAAAGPYPLLAEPSSGARFGAQALTAYRVVLDRLGSQVRRVVVFGRPTLSRPVSRLLAADTNEVIVVAPGGAPWPDAARRATRVVPAVTLEQATTPKDDSWMQRWRDADAATSSAVADVLAGLPLTGLAVAGTVWSALGGQDVLVVGSSNPIRDLDLVAVPPATAADSPHVVANRGLAGIDGTISTATGIAVAASQPTTALLGDLTFLHDAGGLVLGPDEVQPDLRLVVVNDDGGGIFATLEPGEPRYADVFERVFGTPHHADLGALCAGYGVDHVQVSTAADLADVLGEPVRGRSVVEAVVDRRGLRDLHRRLAASGVADQVRE